MAPRKSTPKPWLMWHMVTQAKLRELQEANDPWLGSFEESGPHHLRVLPGSAVAPMSTLARDEDPRLADFSRVDGRVHDYRLTLESDPIREPPFDLNAKIYNTLGLTLPKGEAIGGVGRIADGRYNHYRIKTTQRRDGVVSHHTYHLVPFMQLFCVSKREKTDSNSPAARSDYLTWVLPELFAKHGTILAGAPRSDMPYMYEVDPRPDAGSGTMYHRISVALDAYLERGEPDPRFLTVEE